MGTIDSNICGRIQQGLNDVEKRVGLHEYNMAMVKARQTLELMVKYLLDTAMIEEENLSDAIDRLFESHWISRDTKLNYDKIRILGNKAVHEGDDSAYDANDVLQCLSYEIHSFVEAYGSANMTRPAQFHGNNSAGMTGPLPDNITRLPGQVPDPASQGQGPQYGAMANGMSQGNGAGAGRPNLRGPQIGSGDGPQGLRSSQNSVGARGTAIRGSQNNAGAGAQNPRAAQGGFTGAQASRGAQGGFAGAQASRGAQGGFTGAQASRGAQGGFAGAQASGGVQGGFAGAQASRGAQGGFAGAQASRGVQGSFPGAQQARGSQTGNGRQGSRDSQSDPRLTGQRARSPQTGGRSAQSGGRTTQAGGRSPQTGSAGRNPQSNGQGGRGGSQRPARRPQTGPNHSRRRTSRKGFDPYDLIKPGLIVVLIILIALLVRFAFSGKKEEKETSQATTTSQEVTTEPTASIEVPTTPAPTEAPKVYKTTSRLNVRTEPSTDASRLGTLAEGTVVEFLGLHDDQWAIIMFEGQQAYVSSQYLDSEDAPTSAAESSPAA